MSRGQRRVGCLGKFVIFVIVVVALLVAADFIARRVAENELASQIQQHGFPKKPSVTIEGFPFLTQVASRDIRQVRLSSQNVTEGPVVISKISAVMTQVHLSSGFTGGTVDHLSGSVLITFGSLAKTLESRTGPFGSVIKASGLTLSDAGSDEVKASLNLIVATGSATWRISRLSGREYTATLVGSGGVPSSVLGTLAHFTIKIPQLPLGVQITSVAVTPTGVVGTISGSDLPFGH
jgi:hypothetical protein